MSRDRRFVAVHRGDPLDRESHAELARWAAGDTKTGAAINSSLTAHAAASEVTDAAAVVAARAAGHAAGAAHCADDCVAALLYALKAIASEERRIEREMNLQLTKLPVQLANNLPAESWHGLEKFHLL